MKKLLLLIWILLLASTTFAQEVVSSAGKTEQNSGYEVSWTIGEPVINTLSTGSAILTQGFHQSKLVITKIDQLADLKELITVFPNPTHQFALVRFNQLPANKSYQIFDLSGKILEAKPINAKDTQIDLTGFANGSYLLKIIHGENRSLQTFKIIKQ